MTALASLRLSWPGLKARRPRWLTTRRALVGRVGVAAVVLAVGPTHSASPGPPSATAATAHVAGQHRGLHIPALAVVAVSATQTSVRSFGAGPEQPFVIGSVTKSFTALATMQLVQSGKVRLDDPVVEVPRRLGGGPTVLLRSDVGVVVLCWAILALGAFVVRVSPWRRRATQEQTREARYA
jgi:hypothetical protein